MTGSFGIIGLPWQQPGTAVEHGLNSYTSYILCARHNNSLSYLDAAAARIYKIIMDIRNELAINKPYSRGRWYFASGQALELWNLKTLMGLFHSKSASTDGGLRLISSGYEIDVHAFEHALRDKCLSKYAGTHFKNRIGKIERYFSAAPLTWTQGDEKWVVGIRMDVFLLQMDTILDPRGLQISEQSMKSNFRPWLLSFSNRWRTHHLVLSWAHDPVEAAFLQYRLELQP